MSAVRSHQNKSAVAGAKKGRKAPKTTKTAKTEDTAMLKVVPQSGESLSGSPVTSISKEPAFRDAKRETPFRVVKASPASKLLKETSRSLQRQPNNLEATRILHTLEKALENGAIPEVVDSLVKALSVRARDSKAVAVLSELALLLQQGKDASVLDCLARDLENGADPELVGALADYVRAGLAPNRIAAMAWFFPRSQVFRPRQLLEAMAS